MPSSFMIIITNATSSTPICAPQLPPVMVKNAGALQEPFGSLQVATPRPCLPPKLSQRVCQRGNADGVDRDAVTSREDAGTFLPVSGPPVTNASTPSSTTNSGL
jgi:hypothetical protein